MTSSNNDGPGLRYIRVANALRQKIVEGEYQPGELLPRQHDLASDFDVAYATLKRALDILEDEGYLVRKVGQGTYAALPEVHKPVALVVDDDDGVRQGLMAALNQLGWDTVPAESGEVGLEKYREGKYDLVFLDLMMPGMNGAETFGEVRKIDSMANVVITTGYPDSAIMADALKVGTFSVMMKPFGVADIQAVIDRVAVAS